MVVTKHPAVDVLRITGEAKPQPVDDLHPCNYYMLG